MAPSCLSPFTSDGHDPPGILSLQISTAGWEQHRGYTPSLGFGLQDNRPDPPFADFYGYSGKIECGS